MGNFIAKGLVLIIGLWLIVGGGSCVLMAGFNFFALIGLGIGLLGGWMIWVVFKPSQADSPVAGTNDSTNSQTREKSL